MNADADSTPVFDAVLACLRATGRQPDYGENCDAYFRVTLQSCGSLVPDEFTFDLDERACFTPQELAEAVAKHHGGKYRPGRIVEHVDGINRAADVADFLQLLAADMAERLREWHERTAGR
jgi:hypothetical protein